MQATRKFDVGMNIRALGGGHAVFLEYGDGGADSSNHSGGDGDGDGDDDKDIFGALFLLPAQNTRKSMQSLISNLSSTSKLSSTKSSSSFPLHKFIENELSNDKVDLTLPRFRINYGVTSIKPNLVDLGIKAPFGNNGMFHEMSDDPLLHLDDVYHTAVMEVMEEGTVAAAATVAVMKTRSMPIPPEKLVFDRPFVVIILHKRTGTPLFIGKINDPDFIF